MAARAYPSAAGPAVHNVQRQLAAQLADAVASSAAAPLDMLRSSAEPPRLISAVLLERGGMRAHRLAPELGTETAFVGFLDGTQTSSVVAYVNDIAVVHGTVAAVVRERRHRRMVTWRTPVVRSRLYVPRALLNADVNRVLDALGMPVVDTTAPERDGDSADAEQARSVHPYALADAAVHRVQKDRERAERELAESWCAHRHEPLLIDGGIGASERVAVSTCTVGVVKSHRTLYADGEALQTVLHLRNGDRSSIFRITSPKRTSVASWYLRIRDPRGHDPMWGLIRVEIAEPEPADTPVIGDRADEVSRWILAETVPLALPDHRWDKMVYPIYDCEQFLKSLV